MGVAGGQDEPPMLSFVIMTINYLNGWLDKLVGCMRNLGSRAVVGQPCTNLSFLSLIRMCMMVNVRKTT
jgi:hypothetical protein